MTVRSGTPAFVQVAADLRTKIENGTLATGAQLPSMTQLREMYEVSNTVVRDALNELRREGLIIGQQGKGVFVRDAATSSATAGEGDIMQRLAELAAAVRQLDERMTRLEQDDGRGR
jgi:DNA-binding GntR family transcriptional regulator